MCLKENTGLKRAEFYALAIIFILVANYLTTANAALHFINGSIMPKTQVLIVPFYPGLGRPHVDDCVHSQKHIL